MSERQAPPRCVDSPDPTLADRFEALRAENLRLREDKARLDFLDRCNQRLNESYGTNYRWELILNHNVNRLMLGHMKVDLNDMAANGLRSCREAIDAAMARTAALTTPSHTDSGTKDCGGIGHSGCGVCSVCRPRPSTDADLRDFASVTRRADSTEAGSMTDLTTLVDRIEAGTADEQRELLYDAWDALGPMLRLPLEQAGDFATFVDYGAYVDAAMMLAPERWRLRQINLSAPCADDRKWHLNLHGGQVGQDCLVGRGATLALAIAAAALRAHAYISDGGSALREMVRKAALRARAWPLEDAHG